MTLRLAVLGSPIAHSRSPQLHAAAYRVLGLDWRYDRAEVDALGLPGALAQRGPGWRGMSLTMPLKDAAVPLCRWVSPVAARTGAVNTIVFDTPDPDAPFAGHNTDVEGVRGALDAACVAPGPVVLLGAGNTAASVVVACAERGATDLTLLVRSPERAAAARDLAASLGVRARVATLGRPLDDALEPAPSLVVNTIPGGGELPAAFPERIRASATLLDVVYDPWPTALAAHWLAAGGPVVSGLEMLLHQAVAQVRLFVRPGEAAREASDAELLAAMRAATATGGTGGDRRDEVAAGI